MSCTLIPRKQTARHFWSNKLPVITSLSIYQFSTSQLLQVQGLHVIAYQCGKVIQKLSRLPEKHFPKQSHMCHEAMENKHKHSVHSFTEIFNTPSIRCNLMSLQSCDSQLYFDPNKKAISQEGENAFAPATRLPSELKPGRDPAPSASSTGLRGLISMAA